MKPIHLLAASLALSLTLFAVPNATARSAYRQVAIEQLKLMPDKDGKQSVGCQYCHTAAFGGGSWNTFGNAVRTAYLGDAQRNISQALYLTLKANKDSDGDKYPDALEVFAKTMPGDATSKPSKSVAVLQKEFKAKGGVDQYKPKP
jgi:hypothetical protein